MVALQKLPAYSLPAGDVIQKRIDAKREADREAFRKLQHRLEHGRPMISYPVMPWLLRQEALYWQVKESQPAPAQSQPNHNTWELPFNWWGCAVWKVVSIVGNLYDCFLAAWRYSH